MSAYLTLTVRISREYPASVVVEAVGELDLATAPQLAAALRDATDARDVVLDVAGIAFCGLAGVHVMLEALRSAEERGHTFRLAAPSVAVTHVLEITGALALFEQVPPEAGQSSDTPGSGAD